MLITAESAPASELIKSLADFVLILKPEGQIEELLSVSGELRGSINESWIGAHWLDLVSESERKTGSAAISSALESPGQAVNCSLTHSLPENIELPTQYWCVALKETSRILVAGSDMRPVTNLRQQLLNTQQALEQDYWRLRQVETRYRSVIDMVSDAIVVIDEQTNRILEANPIANKLLGKGKSIVGKPFPTGLEDEDNEIVAKLYKQALGGSRENRATVRSEGDLRLLALNLNFHSQNGESRFLARLTTKENTSSTLDTLGIRIPMEMQNASDAIVFADENGHILAINDTFLSMAQLAGEDQILGKPVHEWLGRSAVDMNVLFNNLKQSDEIKLFTSNLRSKSGIFTEVEISAFKLMEAENPTIGLLIRDVSRRVTDKDLSTQRLPKSIEEITQRVGRVPLKELVRESKEAIETLCIESALKLTRDNRASAAELLGLSRQSLYAKLRDQEIEKPQKSETI